MRYIKGTVDAGVFYSKEKCPDEVYELTHTVIQILQVM